MRIAILGAGAVGLSSLLQAAVDAMPCAEEIEFVAVSDESRPAVRRNRDVIVVGGGGGYPGDHFDLLGECIFQPGIRLDVRCWRPSDAEPAPLPPRSIAELTRPYNNQTTGASAPIRTVKAGVWVGATLSSPLL